MVIWIALGKKNISWLKRIELQWTNFFFFIRFLLFQFILPSIQIILFCVCIGNAPYGLKMAIVNNETQGLGQLFIRELDNETIDKVLYNKYLNQMRNLHFEKNKLFIYKTSLKLMVYPSLFCVPEIDNTCNWNVLL